MDSSNNSARVIILDGEILVTTKDHLQRVVTKATESAFERVNNVSNEEELGTRRDASGLIICSDEEL